MGDSKSLNTKFLIIGLAGPLFSGCSTVAKFLARDLHTYCQGLKDQIPKLDVIIGKYYSHLKNMCNFDELRKAEFQKTNSDFWQEPKMLENAIKAYNNDIYDHEELKKAINRRLRQVISLRDIYRMFACSAWPKFQLISMSDLILKTAIQSCLDENNQQTEPFNTWAADNPGIASKISDYAKTYSETLKLFNKCSKIKDFEELDHSDCLKIDDFFSQLTILKARLYSENQELAGDMLQDFGDNIRATGNPFLNYKSDQKKFDKLAIIADEANAVIKYYRHRSEKIGRINHFVIDSFKNPTEVDYFRRRYGSFYLCSLYADKQIRRERSEETKRDFSDTREKRDQGVNRKSEHLHKQNVSACCLMSDYAITNHSDLPKLYQKIMRLLALIERPGCILPSAEEVFMNTAYSLSLRSSCISRQVGAVITNEKGFIVGAGWNDVGSGQLGCSTRCISDYEKYATEDSLLSVWRKSFEKFRDSGLLSADHTDYFCFKDLVSSLKMQEKIDKITSNFTSEAKMSEHELKLVEKFVEKIKDQMSVKRLEYARALHAEENAILQVASQGGIGIAGGTIYTTTFPCELCAKKIYQSGLSRVVYTEPYPDSLSEEIFFKDGVRSISLEQFEGVKSASFYKLFKPVIDRKDYQCIDHLC